MAPPDLAAALAALEGRYGDAGDGGYALVRAIRDFGEGLAPDDRQRLRATLVGLVAERHPRLWGAALEALAQDAAPGAAPRLAELLADAPAAGPYRRQLLLALLRLRHRDALDPATAYVAGALREGRLDALPVLAALCRVDAGAALALASSFFATSLREPPSGPPSRPPSGPPNGQAGDRPGATPVDGYIPAFASTFLAEGDALLPELVSRTRGRDAGAGATLAAMLDAYLARPWVVAELGAGRAAAARRAVARAATGA